MIGRMYSIGIVAATLTGAARTLVEVAAASDSVVLLERAALGQATFDTSENVSCKIARVATTGTGTATIARPFDVGTSGYGGTCKTNMQIEPTFGVTIFAQGFNVLSGFLWTPANDDEVLNISPSGLMGIMLATAPTTSMDWAYSATIREIG